MNRAERRARTQRWVKRRLRLADRFRMFDPIGPDGYTLSKLDQVGKKPITDGSGNLLSNAQKWDRKRYSKLRGRYRKMDPIDCGKSDCLMCHSERKGRPIPKELEELDFVDSDVKICRSGPFPENN